MLVLVRIVPTGNLADGTWRKHVETGAGKARNVVR